MDLPSFLILVALLSLDAFVLKYRLWVLACALPIGVLILSILGRVFQFYYDVVFLRSYVSACFVGWGGGSFLIAFRKSSTAKGTAMERSGTTAVLLEDTALEACYSYNTGENGSTPKTWVSLETSVPLKKGDLVLVLENSGERVKVMIPYTDPPCPYGYVSTALLFRKQEDIVAGNQAIAQGDTYNTMDGTVTGTLSGTVEILRREGTWAQVRSRTGGEDAAYWVPVKQLSFDFNATVSDQTGD